MNENQLMGYLLVLFSIVFFLLCICYICFGGDKQKLPANFLEELKKAYTRSGNVRDMLVLLKKHYPKGKVHKRILSAEKYLLHSRYRDFETTFKYLADDTKHPELKVIYRKIMKHEVMKQRRLRCKEQDKQQQENRNKQTVTGKPQYVSSNK